MNNTKYPLNLYVMSVKKYNKEQIINKRLLNELNRLIIYLNTLSDDSIFDMVYNRINFISHILYNGKNLR